MILVGIPSSGNEGEIDVRDGCTKGEMDVTISVSRFPLRRNAVCLCVCMSIISRTCMQ